MIKSHPFGIILCCLDVFFPSNHNIHESSYRFCFWTSDPLIDRFYWSLSIKGSEVQKQRPHKLLWMLRFDEKSIPSAPPSSKWCACREVLGYFGGQENEICQ